MWLEIGSISQPDWGFCMLMSNQLGDVFVGIFCNIFSTKLSLGVCGCDFDWRALPVASSTGVKGKWGGWCCSKVHWIIISRCLLDRKHHPLGANRGSPNGSVRALKDWRTRFSWRDEWSPNPVEAYKWCLANPLQSGVRKKCSLIIFMNKMH